MEQTQAGSWGRVRRLLRELYEGGSSRAIRFRYALLAFDVTTVVFVIATSFLYGHPLVEMLDVLFGIVILLDVAARFVVIGRLSFWVYPTTLADLVATLSFLMPVTGEGVGFLRVLRTLRLLHAYPLISRLRRDVPFFRKNEMILVAATNLAVFLFIMTGIVHASQHRTNPDIGNYADALYFTVTALTTTGFGDITLPGTTGRMISVAIMIFGVTLFLRLAQVLFRPHKVRQPCKTCGLTVHDADAVHCKHCGETIRIETEGL